MAPQGALDGSSGRTAGRPARALAGQLLRVGVAVVAGSRLWEHSCSRLGTARRCEPPPAPRVPTLGGRGAQHTFSGRGPRGRLKERMLLADWGSAGTMRHAGRTVGQAVRRHILPRKKHLGRRRFAPAQPGSEYSRFEGRRDENAADTRPRAGEVFRGESTVAPCPLKTVQWVIGHTQHPPGWRGVLGVALG